MTDLLQEIFNALESLRVTMSQVKISKNIKDEMERIMTPFFRDPEQRQRISDAIDDFGDFTTNILVPLLEQYVSSDVAMRVKFLVEDILLGMESYRDRIVKKIHKQQKSQGQTASTLARLNASTPTNHYRAALHQSSRKHREKSKAKGGAATTGMKLQDRWRHGKFKFGPRTGQSQSSGVPGSSRGSFGNRDPQLGKVNTINTISRVGDKVSQSMDLTRPVNTIPVMEKQGKMVGIAFDSKVVKEYGHFSVPPLLKSGQVLVKVQAVGLNYFDYRKFDKLGMADSTQFTSLRNLTNSFIALGETIIPGSSKSTETVLQAGAALERVAAQAAAKNAGTESTENESELNKSAALVGIEFCGRVQDISWKKGDFLHRLHISRDDMVYGILRDTSIMKQKWKKKGVVSEEKGDCSSGALAEYIVCDANDLVRCPKQLNPVRAASLAVDGSVVVRALADTDIVSRTVVLIVGGATNTGLILLELLSKDLKLPWKNIHVMASGDQLEMMQQIGVPGSNVYDYNDPSTMPGMADNKFDVIYDCLAETSSGSNASTPNFQTLLNSKKKTSGRYHALDATRLLAEKITRNEGWQKELNLLNDLVKKGNLSLRLATNPTTNALKSPNSENGTSQVVGFHENDIIDAFKVLISAQNIGKLVVEVTEDGIADMRKRTTAVTAAADAAGDN